MRAMVSHANKCRYFVLNANAKHMGNPMAFHPIVVFLFLCKRAVNHSSFQLSEQLLFDLPLAVNRLLRKDG